jgi:hypothetical protein
MFPHPNARTTPAVRAEIARSAEPTSVLAPRYGVSPDTVRKWRKRGLVECQDRTSRPHKLPWKATDEERAIVCELRRATGFPLGDLTSAVVRFLPHLNRDIVYRILKAEGLTRLPVLTRCAKWWERGSLQLDVRPLSKLQDGVNVTRTRYLYVAVERYSRSVHLAVKDRETIAFAAAFLQETVRTLPVEITRVLTDRRSCFAADRFKTTCRRLKLHPARPLS